MKPAGKWPRCRRPRHLRTKFDEWSTRMQRRCERSSLLCTALRWKAERTRGSQRSLTLAEADKRSNDARYARYGWNSLAAFCEAVPRVKYFCTCRLNSSIVRVTFELLLSLLFALNYEAHWPRRILVFDGAVAPTNCRLSTAAISCDALAAPLSSHLELTRFAAVPDQLALATIGRGMRSVAPS
jgi:hypothetical protein